MKNKTMIAVLAVVLLSGCTSMKYNGADRTSNSFDRPPLGQINTAQVGDQMVSKGILHEESVLIVKAPVNGFGYQIPAGEYAQVGKDDRYTYHVASNVTRNPLADAVTGLAYGLPKNSQLCVISIWSTTTCYDGRFERGKRNRVDEQSFQQTLLYSGRIGDKINISYREFSNDMARPAFNNDVEYDLSVSNVIGYKGASIEVISADNSSITYRVIRNFR